MKVAVTGHTSGIGKALFEYFQNNGHECLGFSRSNGYNIKNHQAIVEQSCGVEVFVNNAYNNYDNAQLILLKKIYEAYPNIYIINVSSRITEYESTDPFVQLYSRSKLLQDEFCKGKKNITNLKIGMVDTPRMINYNSPKMNVADVVSMVEFVLQHQSRFHIATMTVGL